MKRCELCLLPGTFPGITFDAQGVCNYCRTYKKLRPSGEEKLNKFLEPYRNKNNKYDCIVGVSGGRDSSYILYYCVKILKLKALACYIDNGFWFEQAKLNMKHATGILQVDFIVGKHDFVKKNFRHTLSSWMRKPSPATVTFLCAGCAVGIAGGLLRAAKEYRIPLLIYGKGEWEQPFAPNLLKVKSPVNSMIVGAFLEIIRNPHYLKRPAAVCMYAREFIALFAPFLMRKVIYPPLRRIAPFEYIGWDEQKIMSVVKDELKWEKCPQSKAAWRSDCKIALFKNYLNKEILGFSKIDELLSNMIRESAITREAALERLNNESQVPQEFVVEFLNELGLEFADLTAAINKIRRR